MTAKTYTVSIEVDTKEYPYGGGEFAGWLKGFSTLDSATDHARNILGALLGAVRLDSRYSRDGVVPDLPDTAKVVKTWVHTYIDGSLTPNSREFS
ncbi:Uncharacterised protein (plasmid) [Tsukamurella tyrosinosolvens]|uniref:Uncharacterized protein n=1 Tax=Tsukamurella tyrosinosolvens TaxID=57704 RepID=A0A1H4V4F3_TSUTY|nr:hypothetical protein [Tsukamurella tyrosinosolvens]KXO91053.1 hypothetical protein AXK58_21725 [Tsukamurella tyrosinosolvens]SEC75793.1 hypothetical protein SAMN04489793_3136 [Tsukamurella tyrosinosolvens]VEH90692.1 Uncharacterised protein [Tsukamurella tyrosinosolvens]